MSGSDDKQAVRADSCRWCGKALEDHLISRPAGAPQPHMPCMGLRSGFLARVMEELGADGYPQVRLVQLRLCDGCLQGTGTECRTPGCALCWHNSPGHPIDSGQYEIIEEGT